MKLSLHNASTAIGRRRQVDSVALVITLLMLSVITFLAIAFLALSNRNQSSVIASLDVTTAQSMSDAAQARAQAEILAQIMASGDPLNYDYMVSRNYVNPYGFAAAEKTKYDPNNVNYDFLANTTTRMTNFGSEQVEWVQNIANLLYDPRPPVFVVTNPAYPNNYDFRFYVDINRNGRFETNGYQTTLVNTAPTPFAEDILTNNNAILNGEPEWIGMLRNPLFPHSGSNQFIGRYAYLVLPVGKELDINYIHNFLKANYGNVGGQNILTNLSIPGGENDGFVRDQGVGSWELNLAGVLDAVSPWAYESNALNYGRASIHVPFLYGQYDYVPPVPANFDNLANHGNAFDDAEAILHYRYLPPNYTLAGPCVKACTPTMRISITTTLISFAPPPPFYPHSTTVERMCQLIVWEVQINSR